MATEDIFDEQRNLADEYPSLVAIRELIAKTIWDANTGPDPVERHQRMADCVISAIRDACTLTTVEQLDALPRFSVVRGGSGLIWEKAERVYLDTPWWLTGSENRSSSSGIALPALLIWHPGWSE